MNRLELYRAMDKVCYVEIGQQRNWLITRRSLGLAKLQGWELIWAALRLWQCEIPGVFEAIVGAASLVAEMGSQHLASFYQSGQSFRQLIWAIFVLTALATPSKVDVGRSPRSPGVFTVLQRLILAPNLNSIDVRPDRTLDFVLLKPISQPVLAFQPYFHRQGTGSAI